MLDDKQRLLECCYCEYFEKCSDLVIDPEDNEEGSCKTKEIFNDKKLS